MAIRVGRILRSAVEWLRVGYPADAPTRGHSPLIALHGPISLTEQQLQRICAAISPGCEDPIEIGTAILEATGWLPSGDDVDQVCCAIGCSCNRGS